MNYTAIMLCPMGGVVRNSETQEIANVMVGDFENFDDAVSQACADLECQPLHKGVISKGEGKGGFVVISTQELEAV